MASAKKLHRRRAHHLPNLFWRGEISSSSSGDGDGESSSSREAELSIPRFRFERPKRWEDVGASVWIASGTDLENKRAVIAKVAPARTAAGMVLEREVHVLGQLAGSLEAAERAVRLVDFYIIPPEQGDVLVLIVQHPGSNALRSFYPSVFAPSFLCPVMLSGGGGGDGQSVGDDGVGGMAPRERSEAAGAVGTDGEGGSGGGEPEGLTMVPLESPPVEVAPQDEVLDLTEIDLASFLEFAIQATQCLESLHALGVTHGEIRPNAFHWNVGTGSVRLAHVGNRSVSLDVLHSEAWRAEGRLVREAVAYVAPEQTGMVSSTVDHRTDLYSLGATFFALLTGQIPWGYTTEVLQAIVSRRPRKVHDLRPDVPPVLSAIVDKLVAKRPADRYLTASGLSWDLQQVQFKLTDGRLHDVTSSAELVPSFLLGAMDRFSDFVLPSAVYGREKELDTIRTVIQRVSTSQAQHYQPRRPTMGSPSSSAGTPTAPGSLSSFGQQTTAPFDTISEGGSSSRASNAGSVSGDVTPSPIDDGQLTTSSARSLRTSSFASSTAGGPAGRAFARKGARGERAAGTRTVVISGPTGVGKSALIAECQKDFRKGYFGSAKFEAAPSAPYSTILGALSSIFRQLIDSPAELNQFWQASKDRLGPCLRNVHLLHSAIPELREISTLFGVKTCAADVEVLATAEQSRARFVALVLDVFGVLAQQKMITIGLDDLQFADEPSLGLLKALAAAKLRMLIVVTVKAESLSVAHDTFGTGSRATYITLAALGPEAIGALVSDVLHDSVANVAPLARTLYQASHGNVLLVRELLTSMKRANHIFFDFPNNVWRFNLHTIETQFLPELARGEEAAVCDAGVLRAHLAELPKEVRRFLGWASLFGSTIRQQDVCGLMDAEESSGSDGSSGEEAVDLARLSRVSMGASQTAIAEGWITAKGRGFYAFTHDRYRQAAQSLLADVTEQEREQMSLKIADILLSYPSASRFEAADLLLKCVPLLLRSPPVDPVYRDALYSAGHEALSQGAHDAAYRFLSASEQLCAVSGAWMTERRQMFELGLTLVGLEQCSSRWTASSERIQGLYKKADSPCLRARVLFADARQKWVENDPRGHFALLLEALAVLGIHVAKGETDVAYAQVKSLLSVQHSAVGDLAPVTDERILFASELLAEATVAAFWAQQGDIDMIAFKLVELVLSQGMTPTACLGFVWLGFSASATFGDVGFGAQMTHAAVDLAQHPLTTTAARGRTLTLAGALAPYASPLKEARPMFQASTRHSLAAGDVTFACFGRLHELGAALSESAHLADTVELADDVVLDIARWQPATSVNLMAAGTANCIRALHGETVNVTPLTAMDTDAFVEQRDLPAPSAANKVALTWYLGFKIVALHALGWTEDAAALGYLLYEDRAWAESHQHARRAAHTHSLALLAQLRRPDLATAVRERHLAQIALNQAFIGEWVAQAPETYEHWVLLVQAELAALNGDGSAFALYDRATSLAEEGGWTSDLAWCQFLAGSHLVKIGAVHLGTELQQRGVATHLSWGAVTVADSLSLQFTHAAPRRYAYVDSAVQTELDVKAEHATDSDDEGNNDDASGIKPASLSDEYKNLSLADVQTIINGSLTIGANVNLSGTLEALTTLVASNSHAESASIVIRNDDGQHVIATSASRSEAVVVHEPPPLLVDTEDPALLAVVSHVLASHEKVLLADASRDPRFASLPANTRSVACLPISIRGRSIGAIFVASSRVNEFSPANLDVLSVLASQACIAIGNALLFRKLQAVSKANLIGISKQGKALAEARAAREEAIKASRVKSSFLASMSHELRTPFSSFYGLLGLLAETPLDAEQHDLVQTARSSCELLLDIIDSLLDYSKLEAGHLKLVYSTLATEDAAADCLELLSPLAVSKGLELSYKIDPDVPLVVTSDSSRIRQILLNLIGNSLKFTMAGSVSLSVSLAPPGTLTVKDDEIALHVEVTDTGIGMTADEQKLLFAPFVQIDGSTTRRFGGTGLGLSICLQLVKLFGGKIGVRSEPGVGSTFHFEIPVKRETVQDSKAQKQLKKLQKQVNSPDPLDAVVFSPSATTTSFIVSTFAGSRVTTIDTIAILVERMRSGLPCGLLIVDCQSSEALEAVLAHANPLDHPHILRLLAPSIEALKSRSEVLEGVTVLYHPLRRRRLLDMALQLASRLKRTRSADERLQAVPMSSPPAKTIDLFTAAERDVLAHTRVLIAEDNQISARLLVKTLERVKLTVTATSNGTDAVNEWAAHPEGYFALALFDHHMPGANNSGPSAAGRVRLLESRKGHRARLPIIGLSADVQPTARELCISSGMDDYLSKPLRQQDLVALVRRFIIPLDPTHPPSLTSTNSTASDTSLHMIQATHDAAALSMSPSEETSMPDLPSVNSSPAVLSHEK